MKIIHTTGSIEAVAAGPSYTIPKLAEGVSFLNHVVLLYTLANLSSEKVSCYIHKCFVIDSFLPQLKKLGVSTQMKKEILKEAKDSDIIHAHGLWMMPIIYSALGAKESHSKLVLTTRGMLSKEALVYSKGVKRIFSFLFQNKALSYVDCFHATSYKEYEDIRKNNLFAPVAIIPNGVEVPKLLQRKEMKRNRTRKVITIGRIHPIKSLDILIESWKVVEPTFPEWELLIVGPENDYSKELNLLIKRLGVKNCYIRGPVYSDAKLELFQSADLFVMSSSSENFAMSVAESLAAGTPVISTKGTPWGGLEKYDCGWWIDHGTKPMISALNNAMSLSDESREDLGMNGRRWMENEFSWGAIAQQMSQTYEWLINGAERPKFVLL